MTSRIVLPAVVIAIAFGLAAGNSIKCYECIAVGGANDECNGEIMVKSNKHKPIECSTGSLYDWHRKVQAVPQLAKIVDIFRVDSPPQENLNVPMACMKMNLRVDNQPVILRACQTAKTEQVDTCKAITNLITQSYFNHALVHNCTMCESDGCNGSYGLSPTIIVALIPLLGSLFMSLLHNSA